MIREMYDTPFSKRKELESDNKRRIDLFNKRINHLPTAERIATRWEFEDLDRRESIVGVYSDGEPFAILYLTKHDTIEEIYDFLISLTGLSIDEISNLLFPLITGVSYEFINSSNGAANFFSGDSIKLSFVFHSKGKCKTVKVTSTITKYEVTCG
jgi:hypothetical protein